MERQLLGSQQYRRTESLPQANTTLSPLQTQSDGGKTGSGISVQRILGGTPCVQSSLLDKSRLFTAHSYLMAPRTHAPGVLWELCFSFGQTVEDMCTAVWEAILGQSSLQEVGQAHHSTGTYSSLAVESKLSRWSANNDRHPFPVTGIVKGWGWGRKKSSPVCFIGPSSNN